MNIKTTLQTSLLALFLLIYFPVTHGQISQGTSTAPGAQSIAAGDNSTASGTASIALGSESLASGEHSAAIGQNSIASGDNSVALGQNNTSRSFGEVVLGLNGEDYTPADPQSNQAWHAADRLFTVANGTSITDRSNALVMYKDGYTELDGKLEVSKSINVGQDDTGPEVKGDIRYNTVNDDFEGFTGAEWESFTNNNNNTNMMNTSTMYLHTPDIPGEGGNVGSDNNVIEIINWNWGVSKDFNIHGGGSTGGQVFHQDIIITKNTDKSSVEIWRKVVTNSSATNAKLVVNKEDGSPYMMIEFTDDLFFNGHSISADANFLPPVESIVLHFSEYEITYYEDDGQGSYNEYKFDWDIAGNLPGR